MSKIVQGPSPVSWVLNDKRLRTYLQVLTKSPAPLSTQSFAVIEGHARLLGPGAGAGSKSVVRDEHLLPRTIAPSTPSILNPPLYCIYWYDIGGYVVLGGGVCLLFGVWNYR